MGGHSPYSSAKKIYRVLLQLSVKKTQVLVLVINSPEKGGEYRYTKYRGGYVNLKGGTQTLHTNVTRL